MKSGELTGVGVHMEVKDMASDFMSVPGWAV